MKKYIVIGIVASLFVFVSGARAQSFDANAYQQIAAACQKKYAAQAAACLAAGNALDCTYPDQLLAFSCGMPGAGQGGAGYCLPSSASSSGCIVPLSEAQLIAALGITITPATSTTSTGSGNTTINGSGSSSMQGTGTQGTSSGSTSVTSSGSGNASNAALLSAASGILVDLQNILTAVSANGVQVNQTFLNQVNAAIVSVNSLIQLNQSSS